MIFIILLLALTLRLIILSQSFWLDEAISALTAQKPFPYQIVGITGDFQPPLYYLILHLYMKLGITSEWFLRIPSVILGLLTIMIVYKLTKELVNKKVALIASLLLSTSQFHIYYSQELRMYSLLAFLSTLSMWAFFKKRFLILAVTNIFGLYTNYMFGLIFIPQLVWMYHSYKNNWRKWLISLSISFICFLPWLPIFLKQWETSQSVLKLPGWQSISSLPIWKLLPQIFLKFTLGRINFDNKYFYFGIFLLLTIVFAYILAHLRKKVSKDLKFVLNWFISPLVGAIVLSFFIPIAGVWRLIFLLPPFLILVSIAVTNIKHSLLFIMLILAINMGANLIYWIDIKYQRENWRDAVAYMQNDDFPIIFVTEKGFAPFLWYKKINKLDCGAITIDTCLQSQRIYYVTYLQELFDSKKAVEAKILKTGFRQTKINDFPGVGFIKEYAHSANSGHDE